MPKITSFRPITHLSCSVVVHVALAHLADGIGPDLVHLLHRALRLLLRLLLHLLLLHLHILSWSAPGK